MTARGRFALSRATRSHDIDDIAQPHSQQQMNAGSASQDRPVGLLEFIQYINA
jgi:hypothetical protein